MKELAGAAADGMLCSQAGIPPQAADRKFLAAYKKRFKADPILYSPFTYDDANLLIEAMRKADSTDPKKYLPVLAKVSYMGATGRIEFDAKGDRKDAEMTIFTMKGGNLDPIAVVKSGKTIAYAEFIKGAGGAAAKGKK
jgi:branched-chain amino acid transport system substrate-binding protein